MNKKKMENKGFTLVELIVVLVILAILAAILVPALLGYIDRAKEKQYVLNAKSALTATQAEFSSLYGEGIDIVDTTYGISSRASIVSSTADTPANTAFSVKLDTTNKPASGSVAVPTNHAYYTVKNAVYYENGHYCIYNGSTWTTQSTKPSLTDYTAIYGTMPTQ